MSAPQGWAGLSWAWGQGPAGAGSSEPNELKDPQVVGSRATDPNQNWASPSGIILSSYKTFLSTHFVTQWGVTEVMSDKPILREVYTFI